MSSDVSTPARLRRGLLFVVSSPSGAGKTTLTHRLRQAHEDLTLSVSATTRPKRPGEIDGAHYYFIDREEFLRRRDEHWFYETAVVHGHLYGTPKQPVLDILKAGQDVLLDIDWQGAQQLLQERDRDVVSVFILPPSMRELEKRLRGRAQDSEEVIERRLRGATDELVHWLEYDYVLVNEDVDATAAAIDAILRAERLRRLRQPWLTDFVEDLRRQA
ncbi:MAG: guanylate kinase [Caulobacterales bacterium]|nr:guanylate kinase [Caulobacterales bacterium]